MRQEQRELIAELISEKKDLLFASFDKSKNITKKSKSELWKQIYNACIARGIELKSVEHLRTDRIKRSTMRKVSLGKQTGSGGVLLSKLDNTVLSILGKNSAYLQGLNQDDDLPIMLSLEGSDPRHIQLDDSLDPSTSTSVDNSISRPNNLISEANSAEDEKDSSEFVCDD
ncbi:uncharacterized protein LOC105845462 isoform X2 [Hydra vulgaris]|uniref:uncharacterized protein LOC105845462 isoform X2 n=1 Tax=Hydra vulgaris TaxID=6087 RepID=UPI001F5EC3F0|nr:uncharacterized protein LOC105845462 isoform X2 [Hydra vulgaris]